MGNEWKSGRLGDFADVQTGPFGSQLHQRDYVDVGTPIITVEHLGDNRIIHSNLPRVSEKDRLRLKKYWMQPGDIIFSRVGSVDRRAFVHEKEDGWLFSGRCLRVRVNNEHLDSRFLSYFFGSETVKEHIRQIAVGATMPSLNTSLLSNLEIIVPPLSEQRAIAHILGSLDDKIELNRRMNETIEQMVRAIFKSWFVDFDPVRAKAEGRDPGLPDEIAKLFPDGFEESEIGEVPRGWEVVSVEDISEKVACGPFGASIKVSTFVPEGIPIISGKHLNGIRLLDSDHNFITDEHAEKLKNANVFRGDVVFTHAGNIGQVAFIPETSKYERYVLSQRQFYLRCNNERVSPFYIAHYFKSPEGQHKLLANTSSTGVPSISRPVSYLKSIKLTLPPRRIINFFDSYVRPLHLYAAKLENETNNLVSLRDTLLPKLISGEVRITDAEKLVMESTI